jgi:hypothetical protein
MGRYGDSRVAIQEASSIAQTPAGTNKLLLTALRMIEARMEFSESHNSLAAIKSKQALKLAGTLYKVTAIQSRYLLGLTQSHAGATRAARKLCEAATDMANQTGDQQLISAALLAHAEVILDGGDARGALQTALRAQASFARFGQKESEWRAWLLAARASQRLSQQAVMREYALNANARLTSLEQEWGAETYRGYLSRQDIQLSLKQLGVLLNQQN